MPFDAKWSKPFTREAVESLSPNQYGCYGIYNPTTWIYVGRGDIRGRLLDHLNGDNPCILRNRPTGFTAIVTEAAEYEEQVLIGSLMPSCNRRVG